MGEEGTWENLSLLVQSSSEDKLAVGGEGHANDLSIDVLSLFPFLCLGDILCKYSIPGPTDDLLSKTVLLLAGSNST